MMTVFNFIKEQTAHKTEYAIQGVDGLKEAARKGRLRQGQLIFQEVTVLVKQETEVPTLTQTMWNKVFMFLDGIMATIIPHEQND